MRLFSCAAILLSHTLLMSAQTPGGAGPGGSAMTLTVSGFPDGGQIPVKFSQAAPGAAPGEGTSPAMRWINAPVGTLSLFSPHARFGRSAQQDYRRSGALGSLEYSGKCDWIAGRRTEGHTTVRRKLSDQRHGTGVPRTGRGREWPDAPLRVRALCARHQAGCETVWRCFRDSGKRHESDSGSCTWQSGLWRLVPATPVTAAQASARQLAWNGRDEIEAEEVVQQRLQPIVAPRPSFPQPAFCW